MMNKPPVGYLTKQKDGLYGERGTYYDYIFAGNGVWIEAEGPLMAARVQVAAGEVRGLAPSEFSLVLRHGLIPGRLFDLAFNTFKADTSREWYVGFVWSPDGYHTKVPDQKRSDGSVTYNNPENVILDLHSHGAQMGAFFSGPKQKEGTDDHDEQGLKIYGVVGHMDDAMPQMMLRVGAYGYFAGVDWSEVFDGEPRGVVMKGIDEMDAEQDEANLPGQALISKAVARSLLEEIGPNELIELPRRITRLVATRQRQPWWKWFGRDKQCRTE